MDYRLSSFDPSKPEITKANIMSQFPKDSIKIPLPEKTTSEVALEKAEFDTKERKKLAKEGEALSSGKFPIRNLVDMKNAIKDSGRSNNPAKAKSWIKKRAKELDLEDHLPGSWEKATEDELNMFNDELEKGGEGSKGGKIIGHTTSGKPIYDHRMHSTHKEFTSLDHEDASEVHENLAKKLSKDSDGHAKAHHQSMAGYHEHLIKEKRKSKVEKSTNESNVLSEKPEREAHNYDHKVLKTPKNKTVNRDKPTRVSKDMDGDGGGDEMEESVEKGGPGSGRKDSIDFEDDKDADEQEDYESNNESKKDKEISREYKRNGKTANKDRKDDDVEKAFENILGGSIDPIEKSFDKLMGIETDPIERAFSNVLKKGGAGSGRRKFGTTRNNKSVYKDKKPHEYHDFNEKDHLDAYRLHTDESKFWNKDSPEHKAHKMNAEGHKKKYEKLKQSSLKKQLKDQNSYLDAKNRNSYSD